MSNEYPVTESDDGDGGDEYRIRPFRRSDVEDFLDLYEAVWNRRRTHAWFDWRFRSVPDSGMVPFVVAEADGRLVGAEPCLPFRLRSGRETAMALQPADWIVHPDHRRRGLFTRMTEFLLERSSHWNADLFFNFPSEMLLPGLRKFDWRMAGTLPCQYRIGDLEALLQSRRDDPLGTTIEQIARLAGAFDNGRLRVRTALARVPDDVTVTRHETPPVDTLTELYRSQVPDAIHVPRDAAFYRWRASNPEWETRAYVAARAGDDVAALLACRELNDDLGCVSLVDGVPLSNGEDRAGAYRALVAAVIDDLDGAALLKASEKTVPSSVLRAFGFRSDTSFPLSYVSVPTSMVTRPRQPDETEAWRLGGRRIDDVENWELSLVCQDIA